MVRKQQKKRGIVRRQRKIILFLSFEGKNKTETIYFNHFNQQQSQFLFRFAKGNATDPERIVQEVIDFVDKTDPSLKNGIDYHAFAVFDTDSDQRKEDMIRRARKLAEKRGVHLIVSNPCFEVWFIMHFCDVRAPFSNNTDVLHKLQQYISGYKKNCDVFDALMPYQKIAMQTAERLRQYHQSVGHKTIMDQNPGSDVDRILRLLEQ